MIDAEDDDGLFARLNGSMGIADAAFNGAVIATSALYGAKIWPHRDRYEAICLGFVDVWTEMHRTHAGKTKVALQKFLIADFPGEGPTMFANMMRISDEQSHLEWRNLGRRAMAEVMAVDDTGVALMTLAKAYLS